MTADDDEVIEVMNCWGDVTVPDGTALHIYGHLSARIDVIGPCVVIVTGKTCCPAGQSAATPSSTCTPAVASVAR